MNKSIYLVALGGPLIMLPQIMKVWREHNAGGVSLISWIIDLGVLQVWILHAYLNNQRMYLITYLVWFVTDLSMIVGILLFG